MISKITQEEKEFMQCFHYTISFMECMFSDMDSLTTFNEDNSKIRDYQVPMLSFESFIDTENMKDLTRKEKFALKKGAGDCYNFAGRKIGKSLSIKIDIPYSMIHNPKWKTAIYAPGEIQLSEVLDTVKDILDSHDIFKEWKQGTKGKPTYLFKSKNNWEMKGINMKLKSKDPGSHFFGLHVKKLWGEETSSETQNIYEKRKESLSELGAVIRISGMTNFTRQMPMGQEYYNPKNRKKIVNLPQMVSPYWDEEEKKDRIEFYGGYSSVNFKTFVLGEVIEDGISEFDIDRVECSLNSKRKIKRFELDKSSFSHYKNLVVVERPENIERLLIVSDIGDGAGGSDIGIFSERKKVYKLLYNIILRNITEPEQYDFFKWLINKLQANIIALDCGDACGRGIYHSFIKDNPKIKKNLVWYDGNKKVPVGYEKNENGKLKLKAGKPVPREEFMKEWSVRRLKHLLYNERVDIPKNDSKFLSQINSVVSSRSGTRVKYICASPTGDHYFDMFRIFAIAQWLKDDFNDTPEIGQSWGIGVCA